jgi:hypothetical protein
MKTVFNCIVLAMCLSFSGCGRIGNLAPAQYVRYLDDPANELVHTVIEGEDQYTIRLVTPEYLAVKELTGDYSQAAYPLLGKRIAETQNNTYFLIHIGKAAKAAFSSSTETVPSASDRMVMYYAEQGRQDFGLEIENTTLAPITYQFENNYGLAPYNTIILGFETGAIKNAMKLVFNDHYKEHAYIQAAFTKEQLKDLPQLSLN